MNYIVQDMALVFLDVGRLELLLGCYLRTFGRMDLYGWQKILKRPSPPDQYHLPTVSQTGCYSCARRQE